MKLLTRQQFKEAVFARDKNKCVFCPSLPVDAHHIIDRKCFSDGGYYIDNGISVCESCHWKCEKSEITVEEARIAGKITNIILPLNYNKSKTYDKWGKEI